MTETSFNIGTYIDSINFEPFFGTYFSDAFYLRKSIFCLILYGATLWRWLHKNVYLFVSVSVIRPNSLFRFNLISSFYSK